MTTALSYNRQGLERLTAAIENGPPPAPLPLDEALEASHCAISQYEKIMQQLVEAADWDRGQLGLLADGSEEELLPRQAGARMFLRDIATCFLHVDTCSLQVVARELHGVVYGADPTDVTVADLVEVLEGTATQPSVMKLREVVGLLRQGVPQREAAAMVGVKVNQAERLSVRLGIKAWREESKRRAARAAVYEGHTARQLAADYSAVHCQADAMGERRARELMAEIRAEEGLA